ncbi:DsbA family protein [Sneathiella chinensis]|uniref:Disulfide bond formation protein DsbD n=2 Tax=Sneathiella chinensis TaxID=349750 RepID=A0ABQ5U2X4_9PROT|nr:DsbA family protein [Sneathiella chinensis]GLQ05697.1 disulfide bond formation protein DsbD [Sneathiella chinensis]
MKDDTLTLNRRHFVASTALTTLALGAGASLLTPSIAQASVMDIQEDDMVLGDRNAPIGIVEYASLTCPHCAEFHKKSLPGLTKDYIDTGKAFLIYRDFPLDRFALQAAILAHTAGEMRFFAVLKILYEKQAEWRGASNPTEELTKIGKMVGISQAKFEEALANTQLGESILKDRMVGQNDYQVSATPTLFINGDLYTGRPDDYTALNDYLQGL